MAHDATERALELLGRGDELLARPRADSPSDWEPRSGDHLPVTRAEMGRALAGLRTGLAREVRPELAREIATAVGKAAEAMGAESGEITRDERDRANWRFVELERRVAELEARAGGRPDG